MQVCFYWCNYCTRLSSTRIFLRSWPWSGSWTITFEAWFCTGEASPWTITGLVIMTRFNGEPWVIEFLFGDLFYLMIADSIGLWVGGYKLEEVCDWTGWISCLTKLGWGGRFMDWFKNSVSWRGSFSLDVLIEFTRAWVAVILNLSGLLLLPRWITPYFLLIEIEK